MIVIRGDPHHFIQHDGKAMVQAIELPSRTRVSHRPTLQIQELVAVSYGIHPSTMTSRNRDHNVAWPRQIAMYLTRIITHRSMPSIAQSFNKKDHTTVLHAIRTVERKMKDDIFVAADVEALRKALTA